MDKMKFGLFDVFVYTIPGLLVLFSAFLLYADFTMSVPRFIETFVESVDKISINSTLLIIFVSYILGFALHYFGYNFFNRVGKRIWKKNLKGKEESLSILENKFVLVRHYSKENFIYVEQWFTFRGMAFNLALAFLLIGIIVLFKLILIFSFRMDWIIVLIGSLIMSTITLRRAVTFHIWSHNTLNETVDTLNLLDKKNIYCEK